MGSEDLFRRGNQRQTLRATATLHKELTPISLTEHGAAGSHCASLYCRSSLGGQYIRRRCNDHRAYLYMWFAAIEPTHSVHAAGSRRRAYKKGPRAIGEDPIFFRIPPENQPEKTRPRFWKRQTSCIRTKLRGLFVEAGPTRSASLARTQGLGWKQLQSPPSW